MLLVQTSFGQAYRHDVIRHHGTCSYRYALSLRCLVLMLQLSTLRRLRDLRLKVREIDVEGIDAMRSLTDLRSIDLEV